MIEEIKKELAGIDAALDDIEARIAMCRDLYHEAFEGTVEVLNKILAAKARMLKLHKKIEL